MPGVHPARRPLGAHLAGIGEGVPADIEATQAEPALLFVGRRNGVGDDAKLEAALAQRIQRLDYALYERATSVASAVHPSTITCSATPQAASVAL